MAVKQQEKQPSTRDLRELNNALSMARLACSLFKSKVTYASNLYDAAEDVIYACEQMAKEAGNA